MNFFHTGFGERLIMMAQKTVNLNLHVYLSALHMYVYVHVHAIIRIINFSTHCTHTNSASLCAAEIFIFGSSNK